VVQSARPQIRPSTLENSKFDKISSPGTPGTPWRLDNPSSRCETPPKLGAPRRPALKREELQWALQTERGCQSRAGVSPARNCGMDNPDRARMCAWSASRGARRLVSRLQPVPLSLPCGMADRGTPNAICLGGAIAPHQRGAGDSPAGCVGGSPTVSDLAPGRRANPQPWTAAPRGLRAAAPRRSPPS
jgi:hypothetical protein